MSQVTFPLTYKSHRQGEQGNTTRGGYHTPPLAAIFRYDMTHTTGRLTARRKETGGLSQQHFLPIRVQW